jgi:hypothetical protein
MMGPGVAGALRWLVGQVHLSSLVLLKVLRLAPGLGSLNLDRRATLHTKAIHLRMRVMQRVREM